MLSASPSASKRRHAPPDAYCILPPLNHIDKSARNDPEMLNAIGYEWPKLLAMLDDLDELFDEVAIVDFVPVWQSVMRLSCYGVRFAASFLMMLDQLRLDIVNSDEDSDSDCAVDDVGCDDAVNL